MVVGRKDKADRLSASGRVERLRELFGPVHVPTVALCQWLGNSRGHTERTPLYLGLQYPASINQRSGNIRVCLILRTLRTYGKLPPSRQGSSPVVFSTDPNSKMSMAFSQM
jgi:hypothetical protein